MKRFSLAVLAIAAALAGGCAVLNPYDEHTYCRATDAGGRCIDVVGAYTEAVDADKHLDPKTGLPKLGPKSGAPAQTTGAKPPAGPGPLPAPGTPPLGADVSPREQYLAARDARLADLLREPEAPMLAPPKLLRILILPYKERTGEFDELLMHRFTYLKVESSDFLLTDYMPEPK